MLFVILWIAVRISFGFPSAQRPHVPIYEPKVPFSRAPALPHVFRPSLKYHGAPTYLSSPNHHFSHNYQSRPVYAAKPTYKPEVTQIFPRNLSFPPKIRTYKAKPAFEPLYETQPIFDTRISNVPVPAAHQPKPSYERGHNLNEASYEAETTNFAKHKSYEPAQTSHNSVPIYKPKDSIDSKPFYKPQSDYNKIEVKPYSFGYGVKDDYTGADFTHSQSSDGNEVKGSYTVALPDGRIQKVTYTADKHNGFQAVVTYEGVAIYPQPAHYTKPNPVPLPKPTFHPETVYKPDHFSNAVSQPVKNEILPYNPLFTSDVVYSPPTKESVYYPPIKDLVYSSPFTKYY